METILNFVKEYFVYGAVASAVLSAILLMIDNKDRDDFLHGTNYGSKLFILGTVVVCTALWGIILPLMLLFVIVWVIGYIVDTILGG